MEQKSKVKHYLVVLLSFNASKSPTDNIYKDKGDSTIDEGLWLLGSQKDKHKTIVSRSK